MKFQVGQIVMWSSQAGGRTTTKTGRILGICLKGQDAHQILEAAGVKVNRRTAAFRKMDTDAPLTKINGVRISPGADRYIIEVKPASKSAERPCKPVYYLPLVTVVEDNGKLLSKKDAAASLPA